jgi:hypothetical protein
VAATKRYLGARTAFGVIVRIEDRLYNPAVTVEARDGSTKEYNLPFLIAHGFAPAPSEEGDDTPAPEPKP